MADDTLPSGKIKALSLKQPFAWLIANGHLLVDDRSWKTQYTGPILIHASKGLYEQYYDYIKHNTDIPIPDKDQLEYGGIVGIGDLVACCRPDELPAGLTPIQRSHFGRLHGECYGLLFDNVRPLTLIPCPGKLMIFEIDLDALEAAPKPPKQMSLI